MPRTFPWHSKTSNVYHNNSDCNVGRTIQQKDRLQGTGGKPLCQKCSDLNRKER